MYLNVYTVPILYIFKDKDKRYKDTYTLYIYVYNIPYIYELLTLLNSYAYIFEKYLLQNAKGKAKTNVTLTIFIRKLTH